MDIKQTVRKHYEKTVALRRYFHMYPELGGEEVHTQQKIIAECIDMGLEFRKAAGTGVIAELEGIGSGRLVAVRADMDALPVQDECGQPYQSRNVGVCHACGHDGHMAMLLGTARVLCELRNEFAGRVRLIFEPSEERFPCGAPQMISEGALDGVEAIIGAHLWQDLPVGSFGIRPEEMMSAGDQYKIDIQGKGGHGSMPQQTVDALLVGAEVAVALNTIVSRNVSPVDTAVISTGVLQAGKAFNIIPDTAYLTGTVRTFRPNVRENVLSRIAAVSEGICAANGATCECQMMGGLPALINDKAVAAKLTAAAREALGEDNVHIVPPVLACEDFSYYLQEIPGAFMLIGDGNKQKGIIYPQHHPKYDMDEEALACGIEVMTRALLQLLA